MNKRFAPLLFFCAAGLATLLATVAPAPAQSFIRDAELEATIRAYATPIFQTAGLSPDAIKIYFINDKSLNAFVAGGRNLFIHTGLLMKAKDPLEVIGVIAHETGHIAGGHLAARKEALKGASQTALASFILGIGGAILTGRGEVAAAVIAGGQDLALKGALRYTRSQESAADQAAVRYMEITRQSPRGLRNFMQGLAGQEALLTANQDPYLRTHPISRDRVAFFERATEASPYADEPASADLREKHRRLVAKLTGFLEPSHIVLARYPKSDQSRAARYARAISAFRSRDLKPALEGIGALLREEPENPYFHELMAQMLFESGYLAEALAPAEAAVRLLPNEPNILLALARTQIELNQPQLDQAALKNLSLLLREEPANAFAWRLLATAHGRLGNEDMLMLALAEASLYEGRFVEAVARSKRAQGLFAKNTPSWLRAQDVEFEARRRLQLRQN